jgi:hypothetical protein
MPLPFLSGLVLVSVFDSDCKLGLLGGLKWCKGAANGEKWREVVQFLYGAI